MAQDYRRQNSTKSAKAEKPKQAIALSYDPEEDAPKVVASGKGALAERIIEEAKQAKVPVHKDSKLADTLSKLEIGEMIPPQLYEVVAEILVFVDQMDKIRAKIDAHKNGKK
jgi:flagellar biosynthesis protein